MIRKILLLILVTINFIGFAQVPKAKTNIGQNYKIEKNIYINIVESVDKEHEEYAHPVTLSKKALGRILYALKADAARMTPSKVFTIEEIRDLVEEGMLQEAFKKVNKYEKIKLEKVKEYIDENEEVIHSESETLFLFFKNKDELYVTYIPKGFPFFRKLMKGLDMKDGVRWNGKPFDNTISINKKLWTTDIKKPIFPSNVNFGELIKKVKQHGAQANEAPQKQENVKQFSLEDLQTELEKLKTMLDKKLISFEEYKKLKKQVLAKAGL